MFGLNKDGFNRMRYADLIEEMNSRARGVFGADVNLSEFSPLGMIFKVVAFGMSIVWQLAEYIYYGGYKDTAEGYQLDGVGQYIGITRNPATYASGRLLYLMRYRQCHQTTTSQPRLLHRQRYDKFQ